MRDKHRSKLSKLPRKSSFARVRNRCISTGRPRGVLEFFRISRLVFRGLASREALQKDYPISFIGGESLFLIASHDLKLWLEDKKAIADRPCQQQAEASDSEESYATQRHASEKDVSLFLYMLTAYQLLLGLKMAIFAATSYKNLYYRGRMRRLRYGLECVIPINQRVPMTTLRLSICPQPFMLRLDAIQAAVSVYDRERFWKRRPRDASSSLKSDVSSFVRAPTSV
ncbi:hypothetical protein KSP40_PGU001361 [Platanthera guangdongensis]|uniref:Small ribosomal subunit protein uS14m n=1 Tax=Platanthera guangdongensis TaxID=2320717 RepID=A0ABR2MP30_9ASPA